MKRLDLEKGRKINSPAVLTREEKNMATAVSLLSACSDPSEPTASPYI